MKKDFLSMMKENQERQDLLPINALRQAYTPRLEDTLAALAEVASSLNPVEILTATNHQAESEKWVEAALSGNFTNPVFEYNWELLRQVTRYGGASSLIPTLMDQVKEARRELEVIYDTSATWALSSLLQKRFREIDNTLGLAIDLLTLGHCQSRFGFGSSYTYGIPSVETGEFARKAIEDQKHGRYYLTGTPLLTNEQRQRLEAMHLDAEAIRATFLWVADKYGFTADRPVVISDSASSIDVRDTSSGGPVVVIPAGRKVDGLKLVGLALHEVNCHWRSSVNTGAILPGLGSGPLKPLDEVLYEGAAVYADRTAMLASRGYVKDIRSLYYVVAIQYIDHQMRIHPDRAMPSFAETAKALYDTIQCDRVSKEETLKIVWRVTYRVYRGNGDTSKPTFMFTKDHAYLTGFLLARELVDKGLGYILEYSTLSLEDLCCLAPHFQLEPTSSLPYPAQDDLMMQLYDRLLQKSSV